MIEEARMDEKGRINIGKETIKQYGDRFFIVKLSEVVYVHIHGFCDTAFQDFSEYRKLPCSPMK